MKIWTNRTKVTKFDVLFKALHTQKYTKQHWKTHARWRTQKHTLGPLCWVTMTIMPTPVTTMWIIHLHHLQLDPPMKEKAECMCVWEACVCVCVRPVIISYLFDAFVENVSNNKVNGIIMLLIRIWNPNGFYMGQVSIFTTLYNLIWLWCGSFFYIFQQFQRNAMRLQIAICSTCSTGIQRGGKKVLLELTLTTGKSLLVVQNIQWHSESSSLW